MDYCHICDQSNKELTICIECNQEICLDCLAERTPFNLIDTNVCKTCYEYEVNRHYEKWNKE